METVFDLANHEKSITFDPPRTISIGVDHKRGNYEVARKGVTRLTCAWTPQGGFHIELFEDRRLIGDFSQAAYWFEGV